LLTDAPASSSKNGAAVWRFTSDWLNKSEITPELVVRAVRYVIDVKERERREETRTDQLRRRNEELEQFAFMVAHDLQAPLKTILAQCRNWKCEADTCSHPEADEFCSHFATKAITNVERINSLVQRLLDYSRVGRDALKLARVALNDVIQAALEELESSIRETRATIRCGELPDVLGDHWLLVDVFENLIHNSLKFRSDNPLVIEVETIAHPDEWEIRIQDNGIGLDAKDSSNIFALFSRNANSGSHAGDGIGLATCRKIIEHHGGRIWVKSIGHGGAAFCFTLPKPQLANDGGETS